MSAPPTARLAGDTAGLIDSLRRARMYGLASERLELSWWAFEDLKAAAGTLALFDEDRKGRLVMAVMGIPGFQFVRLPKPPQVFASAKDRRK